MSNLKSSLEAISKKCANSILNGFALDAHFCAIFWAHPCLRQAGAFGGKTRNIILTFCPRPKGRGYNPDLQVGGEEEKSKGFSPDQQR
ncbi:MAG: hypothetical protein HY088_04140 [Ignavibacteriales bacterium]|nr:hypothetical protein [Ignavibacteriales bacterium]